MTASEWFRNTEWNEAIASTFEQKLKRARRKNQYLRIQACTISHSHPHIALGLLERYFALGEDFDHAQAYVDRANSQLALGDVDAAIRSFEAALEREKAFPRLLTNAYLDLPYLIALNDISNRFEQAMEILSSSKDRLMFPIDRFKYHTVRAIIFASRNSAIAYTEAQAALEVATSDHSGFRNHPAVGLASDKHAQTLPKLRRLCGA